MPRIAYIDKAFGAQSLDMIAKSNAVCAEFAAQGINLTLRGLYYRLVARDLFPESRKWSKNKAGKFVLDPEGTKNADPNYKWLGDIINDARLAGMFDWDYLEDTTRQLRDLAHWDSPEAIMRAVASQYRTDRWAVQPCHVEVWVEKDALVSVIQGVCQANDVGFFSCRGYTSQTAMHEAAQRLIAIRDAGRKRRALVIIHLGDHDPSGIDMSRDIEGRLNLFGCFPTVQRIALNMDQVEQYDPPPNPAKLTDSRSGDYIANYGDESWELDALDPSVLIALIQDEIEYWRDDVLWERETASDVNQRRLLTAVHERWAEVSEFVDGEPE
jgi:hypothetical protein